jgi:cell division septation protein DedD
MRNLFFTLILANLAFAAWDAWFTPQTRAPRVAASEVPSIKLASEVEPGEGVVSPQPRTADGEQASGSAAAADSGAVDAAATANGERDAEGAGAASATATAVASESPAAAGPDLAGAIAEASCVSVGPFRELSQAATAAANLRTAGFDPVQHAGEGDVWVGYWVYIGQIPTQADANEILSLLRKNGVTDSYVIPNSDSGNLVSLGVFTEIARAGNRRAEVRKLGYDATISDRTRRATVYWVDVQLGAGQALDFDLLQPPGRIVRLEQRPCESAPR